jgi:hypothetical protein
MVEAAPREWRVRYDGSCVRCGTILAKGTVAVWDNKSRSMHCLECPTFAASTAGAPLREQVDERSIDYGTAGASAQREYDRRKMKDETSAKARWGDRLGGLILALSDEKQSTKAWARGAAGEVKLAKGFGESAGIHLLNDRRVPGTRGNIDHLLVASGGVFVVDAKNYQGTVRLRNKGWFLRPDERLYVGRHDRSKLADGMAWQVEAAVSALTMAGVDPLPPITPVLCFIDADWPLFGAPSSFRGVLLEAPRSLRKRVVKPPILAEAEVERIVRVLAAALPPKT